MSFPSLALSRSGYTGMISALEQAPRNINYYLVLLLFVKHIDNGAEELIKQIP